MVNRVADLRPNARPADPDVKIPAAVQRAAKAAEAAQAAAYPENQPPTPTPDPSSKDQLVITDNPPDNPPTAPEPAPQQKQPATVTPEGNPPSDETWEHKFNSERGRRLKVESLLQSTTDRLGALEQLVLDLQSRPAPVEQPATALERLVSAQEENEFGTEMLDVMGRRAKEIVSPELAALRKQLSDLEGRITGTQQSVKRNARQEMLTQLDSRMPTWRQVNDYPEFKAWLALPDPYFGVIRHGELLKAFEQNDTPRVLQFFKGFVSELAATTPAEDPPFPNTPPAPQPDKPGLESLAAPGRARTPAHSQAPAEKQIITTADINAFYKAKAQGAYNGREQEFQQLEQELFKAQREGRVRAT